MIDVIPSPLAWTLTGGSGAVIVMLVLRFLLKQYGEIPTDHKKARAEGVIHDAYRELIDSMRNEISRLHDEVTRIKKAVDDCEDRHRERDNRDEERSRELFQLKAQLRERGLL